jgi:ureidoacrylate peracid hydrolase
VTMVGPNARNSWRVDADAVDVCRPARPAHRVSFPAHPRRLAIDLARTAVLVVDMQNDFCHPDGWLASVGLDVSDSPALAATIAGLLAPLRAAGVPVVWLTWASRPDRANLPPNVLHAYDLDGTGHGIGAPVPASGAPALQAGAWGTEVVAGLSPAEGDIHIAKYRMSGFFDTPLDSVLRNLRVDTLLFTGVNADQCVMATLTDAACLGYDAILIESAVGTTSPDYCLAATVYNVRHCFGFTAQAADVQAALDATGHARPEPGKENVTCPW